MARWTITLDVETDADENNDEAEVAAFAAYISNPSTDHKVTVYDTNITFEGN